MFEMSSNGHKITGPIRILTYLIKVKNGYSIVLFFHLQMSPFQHFDFLRDEFFRIGQFLKQFKMVLHRVLVMRGQKSPIPVPDIFRLVAISIVHIRHNVHHIHFLVQIRDKRLEQESLL